MAAALIAIVICVVSCIVIHLYVLRFLWRAVWPRVSRRTGIGMAVMVLGCIVGHMLEIAIFAIGIYFIAAQERGFQADRRPTRVPASGDLVLLRDLLHVAWRGQTGVRRLARIHGLRSARRLDPHHLDGVIPVSLDATDVEQARE